MMPWSSVAGADAELDVSGAQLRQNFAEALFEGSRSMVTPALPGRSSAVTVSKPTADLTAKSRRQPDHHGGGVRCALPAAAQSRAAVLHRDRSLEAHQSAGSPSSQRVGGPLAATAASRASRPRSSRIDCFFRLVEAMESCGSDRLLYRMTQVSILEMNKALLLESDQPLLF